MKNIKLAIVIIINLCLIISSSAQDRESTTCTSCYNALMQTQGDFTSHLGLENNSYGNYSLSGGWLSETSSGSTASMAFGYRALTIGQYSFALGLEVQAQGNKSFAFGTNVISSGENAKVMGSNIQGFSNFGVTLGSGYSTEIPFYNVKDYSFAIATKSDRATLFVSKSPGPLNGTTGKVGIGTIEPRAKLHIVSDEGEEASLFIEPSEFTTKINAVIKLGDEEHKIMSDGTFGMLFSTPVDKNFSFLNGNVGIGTELPTATLDVDGTMRVSSFATSPGEHKIIFADENGQLFTDNIPLYDNMGDHIAEMDIVTNGNWIKYGEEDENTGIFISSENKVGIGTSNPSSMLDVRSSGDAGVVAFSSQANNADFWAANSVFGYGFGVDKDGIGHIAANFITPVNLMNFYSNGKISIGNATPSTGTSHRLFVEGGITSEEVVINALTSSKEWPDYVFKEDYSLMSIFELKEYINKNGHLPNVPTAVEIETDGQNLGEINAVLVEKIEELTLYLIKQQEEIEYLKSKIDE